MLCFVVVFFFFYPPPPPPPPFLFPLPSIECSARCNCQRHGRWRESGRVRRVTWRIPGCTPCGTVPCESGVRGEEGFCGFCIYNTAKLKASVVMRIWQSFSSQPVHSSQLFSFVSSRQAKIEVQYTLPLEGGGRVVLINLSHSVHHVICAIVSAMVLIDFMMW